MKLFCKWDTEDFLRYLRRKGFSELQPGSPCHSFPHLKQKVGSLSYLNEIHHLFLLFTETKIPLRRGFCTSRFIFRRHHSPLISDLIIPLKVTPMACSKSFLSNSGRHGPTFSQTGEELSRI
ncbi:hypothetical protein V6Z12_D05G416800 [Gossypium hirsutum]